MSTMIPQSGNIPVASVPADIGRMVEGVARLMSGTVGAAINSFRERSTVQSNHLSAYPLGDKLGPATIQNLSWLAQHPESEWMQKVPATCSQGCGAKFECIKMFVGSTACDECREAWEKAQLKEKMTKRWEKLCPKRFRETDTKHPSFPKAAYAALTRPERWVGTESLFLYGPTGAGKTRLGILMIQRALQLGFDVGILWPEKLRSLVQGFDSSNFDAYASIGVLLMDDPLLTACRESKLVDALKMLVDVRMREGRATIITSQIGNEDDITEGKEFGEAKAADKERIKALLRRLRETSRVVSFAPVPVPPGTTSF